MQTTSEHVVIKRTRIEEQIILYKKCHGYTEELVVPEKRKCILG
jgi:hypothetical protein